MMSALSSVAMAMMQEGGQTPHDVHRAMIFSAIIAISLAAQAVGVIIAAVFAMKLFRKIETVTNSFEQKTAPIIPKATVLVEELAPKIKTIAANAEQTSYTVRSKIDELSSTVDQLNRTVQDINERSRVQISRVDGIVTDALATTYEVSRTVQESIKAPVRQIAGVVAGLRAGLETLVERSPFKPKSRPSPYDL